MTLRSAAADHNKWLLENQTSGFGWPITITTPAGASASLVGNSGDIAQLIDPETGQAVSGRLAHVDINIETLTAAGLDLPQGIADTSGRPWLIAFDDLAGSSHAFKVIESKPDRTLGLVSCALEAWQP